MRKINWCIFACLVLLTAFVLTGCITKVTYKNAQDLSNVYTKNKLAFSDVVKVLCKYHSVNNSGLIHAKKEGEKDICSHRLNRTFFEINDIHFSLQYAYSDNEYDEIYKAICDLFAEVDIASIALYADRIVFTLYDNARNYRSWYPQIVYCLDANMDENDLWNTSLETEVLRLDEQWFAYIIMH